eukprot:gb/GEZJ01007865.1/.p1 GENE.gb/GEZJ01007865.1/~~gb/GEZJ01007865.1/.p1  ORF type:complete len:171 (+),score=7.82 gb/GEZJ01007865.1/:1079-1591(+)
MRWVGGDYPARSATQCSSKGHTCHDSGFGYESAISQVAFGSFRLRERERGKTFKCERREGDVRGPLKSVIADKKTRGKRELTATATTCFADDKDKGAKICFVSKRAHYSAFCVCFSSAHRNVVDRRPRARTQSREMTVCEMRCAARARRVCVVPVTRAAPRRAVPLQADQ